MSAQGIVTILLAVVGLAVLAVVLSQRANTTNVIAASSSGIASILHSALSPIVGP